MEFKLGSLMNLISGKSGSSGSSSQPTEQKIVFKQFVKPKNKAGPAKKPVDKKGNKSGKDIKNLKQQNNQKSPKPENALVKSSSLRSSLNFKGTFRRGTLNKSFKNPRIIQGSKPEVAENTSESVVGKSFKYTNSENTFNSGDDVTDGNTNDDKQERTIFVGNLPLSQISEKDISKLFAKYGGIESFRLRSIPLKDIRISKKVAAIKGDFHPERSSTNAYVVMKSKEAAEAALALNGTVLEDHHLRVDKASAREESDPRKAIFLGNVSFKAEEDDLWELFEQCGEIDHVRIIRDEKSSVSKGAAYVNFKSPDSVELALKLEGTAEIHGRPLKIHRYLPGRRKSLNTVSSRLPGPRNTDEVKDDKTRAKEEKRFQKKMRRREKREAENAKNEALGLRSRPLKDPSTSESTAKSFVGVKAEDGKNKKRKKNRFNKGEVQRKKFAKILANPKSEVVKEETKVVEIDEQPKSSGTQEEVVSSPKTSTKKPKKKLGVAGKVTKKSAPKTIFLENKGEIKKKKLKSKK